MSHQPVACRLNVVQSKQSLHGVFNSPAHAGLGGLLAESQFVSERLSGHVLRNSCDANIGSMPAWLGQGLGLGQNLLVINLQDFWKGAR
jgi:hypothetical protein